MNRKSGNQTGEIAVIWEKLSKPFATVPVLEVECFLTLRSDHGSPSVQGARVMQLVWGVRADAAVT